MPSESIKINDRLIFAALGGVLLLLVALPAVLGKLGVGLGIVIAGGAVLAFAHPFVLLSLYFVTLFFKDTTFDGALPISLNQVLAPLFFLSTAAYFVRGKTLPFHFALLPILFIVVLYFSINGLLGENFEFGLLHAKYAWIYLILTVSIAISLSTERSILGFAWMITAITAGFAIHGFYDAGSRNLLGSFTGHWGSSIRAKGTAANSVVFGWNMLFGFPFAFLLFSVLKSRYTRCLAILCGLLMLGVATLTLNRQTYVLILVMVGLCIVLYENRNRAVLITGLMALGGVGVFTVMPMIIKRLLTVTEINRDYSFLERRDSYLMAMEMIKSSPVFGIGFGSYAKVWRNYIPADYSTYYVQYRGGATPKNMDMGYMSILAETGIIGILLFVFVLGWILMRAWNCWRAARKAGDPLAQNIAATAIVCVVFIALTSAIQDTFLYARIWVFYGFAMILDQRILPIKSHPAMESSSVETPSSP